MVAQSLSSGRGSISDSHLGDSVVYDLWSPQETVFSINVEELLAMGEGLHNFAPQLIDSIVAVFIDNSTAIAYLRNQGSTRSSLLNSISQRILYWTESIPVILAPQFIKGSFPGSSETLAGDVRSVRHLVKSSKFSILFTLPRSADLRYGCISSELRRLSGVCISTLVPDTTGSDEVPIILCNADDSRSSLVASESLLVSFRRSFNLSIFSS